MTTNRTIDTVSILQSLANRTGRDVKRIAGTCICRRVDRSHKWNRWKNAIWLKDIYIVEFTRVKIVKASFINAVNGGKDSVSRVRGWRNTGLLKS